MSDYIKGEPCNLELFEISPEDKLKTYPDELVNIANGIVGKWSHEDRVKFAGIPSHMQEREMVRLMHKYNRKNKAKVVIDGAVNAS